MAPTSRLQGFKDSRRFSQLMDQGIFYVACEQMAEYTEEKIAVSREIAAWLPGN